MKEIDARGLDCPEPVVKTRNALKEDKEVKVIVDNKVAAQNVTKLAKKMNCKVDSSKEDENYFILRIKKAKEVGEKSEDKGTDDSANKVYILTSETLGDGEEELGEFLMKGFISTLLEMDPLPAKVIFMNAGVKVPTLNMEAVESLKKLKEKGVTILSCGTCLDYYKLEEELKVGSISNMFEIVESLHEGNVVEI